MTQNDIFDLISKGAVQDLTDLLRKNPDVIHKKNEKRLTPLHHAAGEGNVRMVKLLLASGANPRAGDQYGYPAINSAVWDGHYDVIKVLIDTLVVKSQSASALMITAAERGHEAIIELALDHGAFVDIGDGLGQTPLIYAIRKNQVGIVKILIARGADVNYQFNDETPLSVATQPEIVKLLKKAGAKLPPKKKKKAEFPMLGPASKRLRGAKKNKQ